MIQFGNIAYFWFAAIFSVALLMLNLSTLKRVGLKKGNEFFRSLLWSSIILCLGMTLAGSKMERAKPVKEKMEIIFSLDVSLSTLAKDVEIQENGKMRKISRLDMEKQQVESIIELLKDDAIGITVFADQAIPLQNVLSREDHRNSVIRNLKYIDADFIKYRVKQGTDYGTLILTVLEQFGKKNESKKILFILTDGEPQGDENTLRENLSRALEKFSERKDISVYFIGVGNPIEPSKIPKTEDDEGNPIEYYAHKSGELILTRPNLEFLANLANAMDGHYIRAASGENLKNILLAHIESERRIISWEKRTETIDLTPYLLIGSLIFLFIIPFLKAV